MSNGGCDHYPFSFETAAKPVIYLYKMLKLAQIRFPPQEIAGQDRRKLWLLYGTVEGEDSGSLYHSTPKLIFMEDGII